MKSSDLNLDQSFFMRIGLDLFYVNYNLISFNFSKASFN